MTQYPEAYLRYLSFFHGTRDFFECHEELEAYWKEHPDSPYRPLWLGLIQVAVSLYHQRRGNMRGAVKMMESAVSWLDREELRDLGIDRDVFINQLQERLRQQKEAPDAQYTDIDIPVVDPTLIQMVNESKLIPFDPSVVHKHLTRDRTEVVKTRQEQWLLRQARRNQEGRLS